MTRLGSTMPSSRAHGCHTPPAPSSLKQSLQLACVSADNSLHSSLLTRLLSSVSMTAPDRHLTAVSGITISRWDSQPSMSLSHPLSPMYGTFWSSLTLKLKQYYRNIFILFCLKKFPWNLWAKEIKFVRDERSDHHQELFNQIKQYCWDLLNIFWY